ncbi:hypothetical protein DXD51_01705 [Eubacterium sp. TM05-53]|uniref:YfhO family protein n=1 Tax=uncultured Holdemanella sp. TaxID=1763549 RepID=UPI000E425627|nr:YfhO family protein [uncultured Holdemanella sp.]RGJ72515.1 hypothetical protein DXD51_01705 [Eubacterium sp. TM05-53]
MKKRDKFYITILLLLPILFVLCVSTYSMYGSKLDWLSQHVSLADYFRQTKQLLPDSFANLQGQTNAFSFSYYGLLRPDVLISYLFPNVPTSFFIISYATLLWSFTGGLCYYWLRNKGYKDTICFFSSICCICANCFFQSHQQIMFVEIIPFLFLSLILIDKNKRQWISLCICMALFHNYFYTPGMILILLLYDYDQHKTIKNMIVPIVLGVGFGAVLWLPTGYLIINNHKSVVQTNLFNLFVPNLTLKGLVYDSYGCGLTVISWMALFQGIQFEKTKKLSILLIFMFVFPIFSYILNGTLYARTKILVLCLPLVLMILAHWLQERKLNKGLLVLAGLFLCTKTMFLGLLVALVFIGYYFMDKKERLMMYALVPMIVFTGLNYNQCLDLKLYNSMYSKDKQKLMQRNDLNQRTADLDQVGYSVNRIYDQKEMKASSYTSTSNTLYNTFVYDIIKSPISQSNRTIITDSENYLYLSMMSVQNVLSKDSDLYGYKEVDIKGNYKLLKNKNVFPMVYVTNDTLSESKFDKLFYPYNLDTIYNRTIVNGETSNDYASKMKLIKNLDQSIVIQNKRKIKKTIPIDFDTKNKLICIDFDVKNYTNKKVSISINGMKNTLSKKHSVYPNGNKHFTYILSKKTLKQFDVTLSKGKYKISNIRVYTCDMDVFDRKVTKIKSLKTDSIFKGKVTTSKEGYLVTSYPYEKGYEIYIDGKKQNVEIVNKAFVGCKIKKGSHIITIQFHAPFKNIGLCISMLSIMIGGFWIWKKSKNL